MASSSNTPQTPKSRGHTLFDRQAQLHAYDSDRSSNHSTATICDPPLPVLRPVQSVSSAAPISQSPQLHHRRITSVPLASRGPESHSSQEQLSSLPLPPPDDSNTVQEEPGPSKSNEQPQETDFPLVEDLAVHRLEPAVVPLIPTDSLCCAVIEQAFDYLPKQDDDDDDDNDVVHHSSFQENEDEPIYDNNDFERENQSDGGDSVDTIDLDAEPRNYQQNNSKYIAFRRRARTQRVSESASLEYDLSDCPDSVSKYLLETIRALEKEEAKTWRERERENYWLRYIFFSFFPFIWIHMKYMKHCSGMCVCLSTLNDPASVQSLYSLSLICLFCSIFSWLTVGERVSSERRRLISWTFASVIDRTSCVCVSYHDAGERRRSFVDDEQQSFQD